MSFDVIGWLTFCQYKANRQRFPKTTPAEWGKLFVNVEELEARYQAEQVPEEGPGEERRTDDDYQEHASREVRILNTRRES